MISKTRRTVTDATTVNAVTRDREPRAATRKEAFSHHRAARRTQLVLTNLQVSM